MTGAIDFINLFRVYDTDPAVIEQVRNDHIAPEPITYTEGKYADGLRYHADLRCLRRRILDTEELRVLAHH